MADLGGRHAALPISPLIQSLCFQGLYVVKGEQKSYLLSPSNSHFKESAAIGRDFQL